MSNNTTPPRIDGGMHLSGIDTKTPVARSTAALLPHSWPTPPQSTQDSRRGSRAISCLSDGSLSGPLSVAVFPMPSTPPDMSGYGIDACATQVPHYEGNRPGIANDLNHILAPRSQSGGDIHSDFYRNECSHDADYNMAVQAAAMTCASDVATAPINAGLGGRDPWLAAQDLSAQPNTSPYFYGYPVNSFQSLPTSPYYATNAAAHDTTPIIYGQSPQVFVTSKVSPMDEWSNPQFSTCADSDHSSEPFHDSFYSTDSELAHFELITPPSPEDVCFGGLEKDRYVVVKSDASSQQNWTVGSRPTGITKALSRRPRKRPSRRGKSSLQRTALPNFDCDIILEGAWHFNGDHYVPDRLTSTHKKFACGYKDQGGHACGRRFERAEHLKRHQSSHCEKRKYQCPLGGCRTTKGISRGDNAGDHFKTHLKQTHKGRRNKAIEWPVLRDLLLVDWEEREAKKMISKLEKWICTDPEGANQRHWVDL